MFVNLWHNDTYTSHTTLDDALADFAEHKYDHSLTFDTETGRTYKYAELELLWKEARGEIAADNRHNQSLAAAAE